MVEQKEYSTGCLSTIEAPKAVTTKELLLMAHVEKAIDEIMQLCDTSHRQLTAASTPPPGYVR